MNRALPILALVVLAGCGSGAAGGTSSTAAAATASAAATAASASSRSTTNAPQPAPADDVLPLVCVHGIIGDPSDWAPVLRALEPGRTVVPELYVDEADALPRNSLPPDAVVAFGYYRQNASAPKYGLPGSIGGCPVPRTDGVTFPVSYADRLRRAIEGVKRATGRDRVDLAVHSMGGLIGRAYARWLSVSNGRSSVRRIFLVASPGRGINALESSATAVTCTGAREFMRQGEVYELSYEADAWGGRSFIDQLNDGWDAFCAQHGIRYAGVSLLGEHGAPSSSAPAHPPGVPAASSAPPTVTSAMGLSSSVARTKAVLDFLQALTTFTPQQVAQLPLLGKALVRLPAEASEALGESDGVVRLASSRLDAAPYLGSEFWGLYEGSHGNHGDPERGFASTYAAQCIRSFAIEGRTLRDARCERIDLRPVDVPGRATWLVADVRVTGAGGLAAQLVEETLDATGKATRAIGYGAPLRPGDQSVPFVVVGGGGARRYRLVVYGEHGPIGAKEGVVVHAQPGALEEEPLARIERVDVTATPGGPAARLALGSNGAGARWRVRLDGGPWSDELARPEHETPPLLPGHHRVEVVVRHASNGARLPVDGFREDAVGLLVDASGRVTIVR